MEDLNNYGEDEYAYTDRLRRNYLTTAVISFILGIVVSYLAADSLSVNSREVFNSHNAPKINNTDSSEKLIAQGSVIDVARRVKPSVVNIQTEQKSVGTGNQEVDGVGSGIIVRSDGYIITNEHVVAHAKKIIVSVKGNKEKAKVIGSDKETDVAVIKIEENNLPVPKFASDSLVVGELAVAIGSPFGFQRSVTAGVISALDRSVTVNDDFVAPRTYSDLIQTDAAINPGNSGGALSNKDGEVIGMNSLIYSNTGVSQGVGFAIPIDKAQKAATEIMEKGDVSHPFLGVLGKNVDESIAQEEELPTETGVMVKKVMSGSPAEKSGIDQGDVIVKVNNKKISTLEDLINAVESYSVGTRVNVELIRNGKKQAIPVQLEEKRG